MFRIQRSSLSLGFMNRPLLVMYWLLSGVVWGGWCGVDGSIGFVLLCVSVRHLSMGGLWGGLVVVPHLTLQNLFHVWYVPPLPA